MFHQYRDRVCSTDSDSDHSVFNKAFQSSSAAGVTSSFNSTDFTSTEAIPPPGTDESDLRQIIENDTFLKTASKNDSLTISRGRSPSFIIAAGTVKGSTANTSIESLQSMIIDGAMDSDASFYSPSETLTNFNLSAENILDKRLSTEDEFTDCESSPEPQTPITVSSTSTKYKSLRLTFSPKPCSENNNTIFKQSNQSSYTQISANTDSGIASNAVFNSSNKFSDLPRYLQHLTTILEESTALSNHNSRRISGVQLMPIIENLRKGPMPHIPETVKFNETIITFAQILEKSSREITIDQLAQILLYTLQTDYSYPSEHLSGSETFMSYGEMSRLSGVDSNNTGKELDSIIRQLKSMYPPEKNIESESSPEWPSSLKVFASRTPKNIFGSGRINQRPSSFNKKKEYFPMPPFSNVECNKENFNLQRTNHRESVDNSPKKNKICLSSELSESSNFNQIFGNIQKKKYVTNPRFKRKKENTKAIEIDKTTASEDSFLQWEHKCMYEEKRSQRNLRRSMSVPDIATEDSTTSEVSRIDYRKESQKLQKTPRYADDKLQEKVKRYRKRRSRSVEYKRHLPVQTNFGHNCDSSRNKLNFPSTSGVQRRRSSNQKKGQNSTSKLRVKFGNVSSGKTPTQNEIQQKNVYKNSSYRKTPCKSSLSRRSCGIDSSHIPAVSQLRRVFSPAERAQGPPVRPLSIPRIEITRSSPERSVNNPTPILALRRKRNLSKSQEKVSPRKPWRP